MTDKKYYYSGYGSYYWLVGYSWRFVASLDGAICLALWRTHIAPPHSAFLQNSSTESPAQNHRTDKIAI